VAAAAASSVLDGGHALLASASYVISYSYSSKRMKIGFIEEERRREMKVNVLAMKMKVMVMKKQVNMIRAMKLFLDVVCIDRFHYYHHYHHHYHHQYQYQ